MQLSVKGRQIDVGEALRTHVEAQLKDIIGKYFSDSLDAHVTFSREAHLFRADIAVHAARGILLQSNASASEPYPAFDLAAGRIAERLRRHKNRIKQHHHHESPKQEAFLANSFVLHGNEEAKEEEENGTSYPAIVAEMTTQIETLTVSQAVMRLDLGDLQALMFRNSGHGGLNMIYRRVDGNIGWVDPADAAPIVTKLQSSEVKLITAAPKASRKSAPAKARKSVKAKSRKPARGKSSAVKKSTVKKPAKKKLKKKI
jgi:ribosomal subunit interface protein